MAASLFCFVVSVSSRFFFFSTSAGVVVVWANRVELGRVMPVILGLNRLKRTEGCPTARVLEECPWISHKDCCSWRTRESGFQRVPEILRDLDPEVLWSWRTLILKDPDPEGLGSWRAWVLKDSYSEGSDPKRPGSWRTQILKDLDPEGPRSWSTKYIRYWGSWNSLRILRDLKLWGTGDLFNGLVNPEGPQAHKQRGS